MNDLLTLYIHKKYMRLVWMSDFVYNSQTWPVHDKRDWWPRGIEHACIFAQPGSHLFCWATVLALKVDCVQDDTRGQTVQLAGQGLCCHAGETDVREVVMHFDKRSKLQLFSPLDWTGFPGEWIFFFHITYVAPISLFVFVFFH